MRAFFTYVKKSDKYKNVYESIQNLDGRKKPVWRGTVVGMTSPLFSNERECAKWVDIALINKGKKPINVLKPI